MTEITSKYRILVGLSGTDTSKDDVLSVYLDMAEKRVVKARYPFGSTEEQKALAILTYSDNVDSLYVVLYNKQGAEGESSHTDNGTSRSYLDEVVYLRDIVPVAKILV